jgi:hypothetical protein
MYKITDMVETGHSKDIGGSLKISFMFDDIVDSKQYFNIIDYLDHCLITDNEMAIYSHRFILLNSCKNLFEDVHVILSYFLINDNNVKNIIVTRNKESFSLPPLPYKSTISIINKYNVRD